MIKNKTLKTLLYVIFGSLGMGALAVLIQRLVQRWRTRERTTKLETVDFQLSHQGLSQLEVEQRRTDDVLQAQLIAEKQAKKERWNKNAFTIFNVTILVLAVSQVLLRDPLGALATLGTLILSIGINIFQETRAASRVGELARRARPMALVIRDGRLQSIDQDELVVGDVLVAGKGDEILADGVLLESANLEIDESKLANGEESIEKQPGDSLTAGTYCKSGWVVYRRDRLNVRTQDIIGSAELVASIRTKTPLQKIIEQVLYVLLVVVSIFYTFFFLEVVRIELLPPDLLVTYREVMSIIFSILPSGLLLMIVINYAVGSAEIARSDVLVHNSQTIESLAQVSTVCFIRHGGLMGLTVELEMLLPPEDTINFSERRVRQALGNYVHSISGERYPITIIRDSLDGEPHAIHEQARYLSLYGWEAMTFSSADMPGTFVIGYPEVLEPNLKSMEPLESDPKTPDLLQENTGGIGGQLRRWFGKGKPEKETGDKDISDESESDEENSNLSEADETAVNASDEKGFFKAFRKRLNGVFQRKEKDDKQTEIEGQEKIKRLMFAYSPSKQSIYDEGHYPQCPQDLIPLSIIKFIDEVRPEVMNTVKFFKEEDISLKILTEAEPANTLTLAHQLGIIESERKLINGHELSQLPLEDFEKDVIDKTIFTNVNSDQMIRIIKALQAQGEHVAVLGTSIRDLPIMQTADLSITRKGSSPTVLDQADIIVLKNTFNALTDALQKGQRIVNSVMDVLKLNLTRITYTLILVIAMYIAGERTFFFHPAQGGMINVFTIVLPSIALSLWASATTIDGKDMPRLLFHFITPAAIITSLAVLMIDFIFQSSGAGIAYSQLAVTHALVLMGLFLTIFVQPPVRFLVGGDDFGGGWQTTISALVFYILFHITTLIPAAQRWLRVAPLQSLWDYLLILLIGIFWAILVIGTWRLVWPERFRASTPKPEDDFSGESIKS